jgi:hypothetical protein
MPGGIDRRKATLPRELTARALCSLRGQASPYPTDFTPGKGNIMRFGATTLAAVGYVSSQTIATS